MMTYTLVAQGGAVEDRHFLAQLRDAINDCLEEFRWFTLRLWSGCLTTKSRLGRREQSMGSALSRRSIFGSGEA